MEGVRCIGGCLEEVTDVDVEDEFRYWSKIEDWDETIDHLPLAGEMIEIIPGWNMIYDIDDSPVLEMLTINGRLTFGNTADRKLQVKHLFIRTGELIIGEETDPFTFEAEIRLHGELNSASFVYDGAHEAGNKLLSNLNVV